MNCFQKFFSLILLSLFFLSPSSYALTEIEQWEEEFKQYQVQADYGAMTALLEKMIASGYVNKERFKRLGDLYFFTKQNEKGLDVARREARWANTSQAWEKLSDLLLWKEKREEGRTALEKSLSLDPNNQALKIKLAGVYEYHRIIDKSLAIWKNVYEQKKDLDVGEKFTRFYLRNGNVTKAGEIIAEMEKVHGEFQDTNLKVLKLQISVWGGKTKTAANALKNVKATELPQKDLDYYYSLAMNSNDLEKASQILDQSESLGKSVWEQRFKIFKEKGDIFGAIKIIEEQIKKSGEDLKSLTELYNLYRSLRMVDKSMEILEKVYRLDYQNLAWARKLSQYYDYTQKYSQAISLFKAISNRNQNPDVALLYLAQFYLKNRDFAAVGRTIPRIKDPKLKRELLAFKIEFADAAQEHEKSYQAIQDYLPYVRDPNLGKSKVQVAGTKSSQKDSTTDTNQKINSQFSLDENAQNKEYINLIFRLQTLSSELKKKEEEQKWGRLLYELRKKKQENDPSLPNTKDLIDIGQHYSSKQEQEENLVIALDLYPNSFFHLHYFLFLMKEDRKEEGGKVFQDLLEISKTIRERKLLLERTYGLIEKEEVRRLYYLILDEDPFYLAGMKYLGQVALDEKDLKQAELYIKRYMELSSHDPEIIFAYAELLKAQDRQEEAQEVYEQLIENLNRPNRPWYLDIVVAMAYMKVNRAEDALDLFQSAKKEHPELKYLVINEMEALVQLKRWDKVLKLIEDEKLEQSDYPLHVGLVKYSTLNALGKEKESRSLLEKLVQDFPNVKYVISTLAYFHSARGEEVDAMKYLERAKFLPPSDDNIVRDYQNLKRKYSNQGSVNFQYTDTTDQGVAEATLTELAGRGRMMITKTDRAEIELRNFSGTNHVSGESANKTLFELSYLGSFTDPQKYEIHLRQLDQTGARINYFHQYVDVLYGKASLLYNLPDTSSVGVLLADSYYTGAYLEAVGVYKKWEQSYFLSYLQQTYQYQISGVDKENQHTELYYGLTQSFLRAPNLLAVSVFQKSTTITGDLTGLYSSSDQIEGRVSYSRYWTPFLYNEYVASISITTKGDEKTVQGLESSLSYAFEDLVASGTLRYLIETTATTTKNTIGLAASASLTF